MLSVQPPLTPDEVRFKLQSSARAFPTALVDETGTVLKQCVAPTGIDQLQCVCVTGSAAPACSTRTPRCWRSAACRRASR